MCRIVLVLLLFRINGKTIKHLVFTIIQIDHSSINVSYSEQTSKMEHFEKILTMITFSR